MKSTTAPKAIRSWIQLSPPPNASARPTEAVSAASTLIWTVMRARGYPADDRNASMEALSFYHARSLEGYRLTQDIRTGTATTEELRAAMIRFRALFEDLTGLRNDQAHAE